MKSMIEFSLPDSLRSRIADMRGRGVYSGYADRHRCIFIHIPKAAGTSVAQTLFGEGSRHLRYSEYEQANPRKFREYFKFTFVRNPWSRLYSAYSFLKKGGMNEMDRTWAAEHLAGLSDFDSFVKEWVTPENIRSWIHFYPQHYFVCDDALNLKMDFVGQFESMDCDIASVQERLSLPIQPLNRINVTHKSESSRVPVYSEESEEIVRRVYANDIELFGYEFPEGMK